jgi:hypothetical protein
MITAKTAMIFALKSLLNDWERLRDHWEELNMTKSNGDKDLLLKNISRIRELLKEMENEKP